MVTVMPLIPPQRLPNQSLECGQICACLQSFRRSLHLGRLCVTWKLLIRPTAAVWPKSATTVRILPVLSIIFLFFSVIGLPSDYKNSTMYKHEKNRFGYADADKDDKLNIEEFVYFLNPEEGQHMLDAIVQVMGRLASCQPRHHAVFESFQLTSGSVNLTRTAVPRNEIFFITYRKPLTTWISTGMVKCR